MPITIVTIDKYSHQLVIIDVCVGFKANAAWCCDISCKLGTKIATQRIHALRLLICWRGAVALKFGNFHTSS